MPCGDIAMVQMFYVGPKYLEVDVDVRSYPCKALLVFHCNMSHVSCNVCHCPQMFYVGPNYLEVDLDVHNYAFLARKALWGYHDRIPTVVWDNGFVIQVGEWRHGLVGTTAC